MKLIVSVLLILISQTIHARKEYLITLIPDSIQWENLGFYIADVKDQRSDPANIGYVWKGIFDTKTSANFKDGFENTLARYMGHLTVKDSKSIPIIVSIRELKISEEDGGMYQIGRCHLVMEYFDYNDKLLYMTDYSNEYPSLDVTRHHAENIKYLIQKSILAFSLYDIETVNYFDLLKGSDLHDSILLSSKLRIGFYANYKEFQANNPSIKIDSVALVNNNSGAEIVTLYISGFMVNRNLFFDLITGFCDGENIYLKAGAYQSHYAFIPVSRLGRYCYMGKKSDRYPDPKILSILSGDLTMPYNEEYILDIRSGLELKLTDENIEKIISTDTDLFESFLKQPLQTREEMTLYWLEQYNKRYLDMLK